MLEDLDFGFGDDIFEELSEAFDIEDISGFDFKLDEFVHEETRIIKPALKRPRKVAYTYAKEFAEQIQLTKGLNLYAIVGGNFIFGDFLEALLVDGRNEVKRLDISTLSLSQENIDSLRTIMDLGFALELSLIVSHYFYSHERHGLVPYLYEELDRGNRFQFAVAGSHCKVICFETFDGLKFTVHGSANLRSSQNLEQLMITQDDDLYDFNMEYMRSIKEQYSTIKHAIANKEKSPIGAIAGRGKSWQQVRENIKQET